jgi:hypothetical protein
LYRKEKKDAENSMGKERARLFHFFIILLLDLRHGGLRKGRRWKVIREPGFPVLFSTEIFFSFAIDPAVTEHFPATLPATPGASFISGSSPEPAPSEQFPEGPWRRHYGRFARRDALQQPWFRS